MEDAGMLPARTLLTTAFLLLALTGCGDDAGEGSAPAAPQGVQPEGVYEYSTAGGERIGGPLPGTHRFRATSTVAVDVSGCDLTERWDALPERWAEWRYCVTGETWRLESVTDHHEFFGQIEEYSYRCSGRRVPRPDRIQQGFTWTDRCRATRHSAVARGEVVSIAPVTAAGQRIEAVRLRVRTAFTGRVTGGYVMDSWLRRSDGLLLRRTFDSETRVRSTVGTVPARERYSLRIRSLSPG
jgi:hypothetical protein